MYFGFKNISISYKNRQIIENLSVEFPKGSITTIVGQNGSGKSSLLKTVSRAVTPDKGNVLLEGKSIRKYPAKELAQKIGYFAQVHTSPDDIDVRTLVSYGRYPHSKFGKGLTAKDVEVVDRALIMTGLKKLENQMVSTLSGGERQRAWIAMTICQEPKILILDEPTTYLDISYQVEVLELVQRLNRELGMTIIMVLHDLNLAARYSDYLYALKDGKLYAKGTPQTVLTENILKELFHIEASVQKDTVNGCPYFIPIRSAMAEAM